MVKLKLFIRKKKMVKDRIVLCAGCSERFGSNKTEIYRRKRCCGNQKCIQVIDQKVTNANYKRQQKKIKNGKFRHGVPIELKQKVYERDGNSCKLCLNLIKEKEREVHHILPVSENGADDLKNLILLCNNCHTTVHKKGHNNYYGKFNTYIGNLEKIS
jgi:5-methylcytosine-specific restriction endonuclease McrA